jgi:hypothetical protein
MYVIAKKCCIGRIALTACGSWQVQTVSPQQVLSDPRYAGKTVQLTTMGNERTVVRDVQLRGERVVGREGYSPFTIPLAKVREVATKHFSPERTVGLIAGTVATLGGVILLALITQHDGS